MIGEHSEMVKVSVAKPEITEALSLTSLALSAIAVAMLLKFPGGTSTVAETVTETEAFAAKDARL